MLSSIINFISKTDFNMKLGVIASDSKHDFYT